MAKIDTVEARGKLKAKAEPYWARLSSGCTLGFRKMTPSSVGTWIARFRDADTGKRDKRSLGELEGFLPAKRYDEAKRAAEEWFVHLGKGGAAEVVTVKVACERYVMHVRSKKGDPAANDIAMRFKRWVYGDRTFAETKLEKLARPRVESWRQKLVARPVQVNRDNSEPVTRARSPASVNRDVTALRAALNHAHDCGSVTTDMAWRVALRPTQNADGRREVYLDREQRRRLIEAAAADVALLLRGLSVVPLRPGALAALTASSFDKRLGVLTIGKDKTGGDRKIKLPTSTAKFFADQTKDKLPAAPLLTRASGKAWNKDSWKWPIKDAAVAAKLPNAITAYALRHSAITDLVTGGLDLLTVAQLSGTSVAMIEKHYGHFRADHAKAALATLAL